jgi:hypothetical protein
MRTSRQRDSAHSEEGHHDDPARTPTHPLFRMIHRLSACFAESDGRNDDALLPGLRPESLLAFEPIWARLPDHAHLVPGLAAASAAGGAGADASAGWDST